MCKIIEVIEFGKKISIVYHKYRRFVVERLSTVDGFNPGWVPYLKNIQKNEGIVADELARRLMVSRPMVAKTIRQLEEAQLVEVIINTEDKRNKNLFLTERGSELLAEINPMLREVQTSVLEGFSPEETELFGEFLERILDNIEKE